jgi:hypothetical protein
MVEVTSLIQNPAYSPSSTHLLYPYRGKLRAAGCGLCITFSSSPMLGGLDTIAAGLNLDCVGGPAASTGSSPSAAQGCAWPHSLTTTAQPIYQDAHGPRTVMHLGSKIKGAVHAGVLPTHGSGPCAALVRETKLATLYQ